MAPWKKTAFALILVVVGYIVYVYLRDGDFSSFGLKNSPTPLITLSPTPLAVATTTVRPAASPVSSTVLSTMNVRRSEAGGGALSTNSTLQSLAQAHADDMAAKSYFSHTNSAGTTFEQRIAASGYSGTAFAENIGYTSSSAVSIVADWMASADHKSNMLSAQYTAVGVGISQGTFQGRPAVFVVAVFGNK